MSDPAEGRDGDPLLPAATGVELAMALVARPPAELSDGDLVDAICAWDRLVAWAHAQQCAAIAEFARRRPATAGGSETREGSGVSEWAIDELSAALRLSRAGAGNRLHLALELAHRLAGTADALARGEIDLAKVRSVVEATGSLDAATAASVEAHVLRRAGRQTVGQLRASLRRAVLAADPASAEERHQRAVQDRRVTVTPLPDGVAELYALLSADAATAIYTAIDDYARSNQGLDPARSVGRTPTQIRCSSDADAGELGMDARRADALLALVTGSASAPMRPLVHVTVAARTLLGLDDAPTDLAGHGPIPASVARRVAADPTGTWRRLLTDPATGTVVDVGAKTYRPPSAVARHVAVRDGRCRFPGCRQPAHRCDLDHVRPWPNGPTSAQNLITLCRRHHRLKHSGRWQVQHAPDGTLTWTAPTGHTYATVPATTHRHPPTPQHRRPPRRRRRATSERMPTASTERLAAGGRPSQPQRRPPAPKPAGSPGARQPPGDARLPRPPD